MKAIECLKYGGAENLVEQEKIIPVIDNIYPLEKMAEAHKYVEMGHKRGNVIITI